jgi:beta-lactamase regulating signal transducer with metallopeptidase domain
MMLALLAESALRSLLLGAAVWLALKLLRVRNPHVQMTAWTLVLIASLAMPLLMRVVTITIPDAPPSPLAQIVWAAPAIVPPALEPAPQPVQPPRSAPVAAAHEAAARPRAAATGSVARAGVDWRTLATAVYALVAAVLLLRLLIGLALTWRLARAARPVRAGWTAGVDVRVSDLLGVPVTFGSTILLPTDHVAWGPAKRRAVLTHERAHVVHGDFYVLLLAALNRAVFWFNPFAWWQFTRLAELAEIISDDAALEALEDRPRYAGILLDVAACRQRVPAGLAMARPGTVRRRIERILASRGVPTRPDWRKRALVATALLPLVAACAVTIAHGAPPAPPAVPAAREVHEQSGALARYAGLYQAGPRALVTIAADGERLSAQLTGQPPFELARASDTEYVSAAPPARVSFVFEGEAPASALVLRQNNRERRANRVDAQKAAAIEAAFTARITAAPERFRAQTPAPGSRAAALRLIEDVQHSAPGDPLIGLQLGDPVRQRLPQLRTMFSALGPLQSLFFRGVGPGGYDIYGAEFANGSADFRVLVATDGTVEDLLFRPNGDGRAGEMIACKQEPGLRPSPGSVPINVLLFNASGAEVQLFVLDGEGQRKAQGTVGDNRSRALLAHVGQQVIIADASGRCLGIASPGVLTRFLRVGTARAGEPVVVAWPTRVTPRRGSEEALHRYIDALGRGAPQYAEMTEEAAAHTRQQLVLDQAILAALGPLRAMSFRGVSAYDNDIYMAQFANGAAEWRIRLLEDGRIAGISLGPQY